MVDSSGLDINAKKAESDARAKALRESMQAENYQKMDEIAERNRSSDGETPAEREARMRAMQNIDDTVLSEQGTILQRANKVRENKGMPARVK